MNLRRLALPAAVVVIVVVALIIALLVTDHGSSSSADPSPSPTPSPSGPALGPAATKGTQTFHLVWRRQADLPPPVTAQVRLADGRAVGFSYAGTKDSAAQIGINIGPAKRTYLTLPAGRPHPLGPGVPVTIKVTHLTAESADLEVTVT